MTAEELKQLGYKPMLCKIGTLYFKEPFFCSINSEGVVDFRYWSRDMEPVAKVTTVEELMDEEINYYENRAKHYDKVALGYRRSAQILRDRYKRV